MVNNSKKYFLSVITLGLYLSILFHPAMVLSATAYKCISDNNETVFSDKPCEGKQLEQIYIHENYFNGESLRPEEIEMLNEIKMREEAQTLEKPVTPEITDTSVTEAKAAPHIDKEECKQAGNALLEWQRVMKLGYAPEESDYYITELNLRMNARAEKCGQ